MINFGLISTTLFDTLSQKLEGFIGQNWYFLVIKDRYNAVLVLFACFWALALPISAKSQALEPAKSTFPDRYVHVSPEAMISWIEEEISSLKTIERHAVTVSENEIRYDYSLGSRRFETEITFANCNFDHIQGVECRHVVMVIDTGQCNSLSKTGPRHLSGVPFGFADHHAPALDRCHMALFGYLAAEGSLLFIDGLSWFLEAADRTRSGRDLTGIPSTVYLRPDKAVIQKQFDSFHNAADRYLEYLPVPSDLIPLGEHYQQTSDKRLQIIELIEPRLIAIPALPDNLTGTINLPKSGPLSIEHSSFCGALAILGDQCSNFRLKKNLQDMDESLLTKHRLNVFPFLFETQIDFYTSIPSLSVTSEFTLNNKGLSVALLTEILSSFDDYFYELQALL